MRIVKINAQEIIDQNNGIMDVVEAFIARGKKNALNSMCKWYATNVERLDNAGDIALALRIKKAAQKLRSWGLV